MDKERIKEKFGEFYIADDYSFIMGIDVRFTDHLAKRFVNKTVLETCTGAGFTTISLAKYAKHVYSIEIDATRLGKAKRNSQIAGYDKNITFINGDSTSIEVLNLIPNIDSAFIDPDWAIKEDNHIFKFINSNTEPPSDKLFELIRKRTSNRKGCIQVSNSFCSLLMTQQENFISCWLFELLGFSTFIIQIKTHNL